MLAAGPLGAEPLLVQVGFTRFALRRAEAERVRIRVDVPVVSTCVEARVEGRTEDREVVA